MAESFQSSSLDAKRVSQLSINSEDVSTQGQSDDADKRRSPEMVKSATGGSSRLGHENAALELISLSNGR